MILDESASNVVERPELGAQNRSRKATNSQGRHDASHRTVIIMSAGLLLGALAAVGHHLWYNHWNHKVVETASWSQTWIKNFGTAFAFLVKMFLAIVTSTAFVQQFWITVKAKPVALGQVDSMFTVLQSALQFLSLQIWMNNPILAFLAIITWQVAPLLPLASIVTPGTLDVISVKTTSVVQYPVPQFDFISKSDSFGISGNNGGHALGASPRLQRLSIFATSGLEISQIQIPYANASYELEFFAPTVSCSPASASTVTRVSGWLGSIEGAVEPWLSFVPAKLAYVPSDFNPFDTSDTSGTATFFGYGYNYGVGVNQSVSLFVAMDNGGSTYSSWPMVECTLYNASYQVNFQFTYPHQNISVIQRTLHSAVLTPGDPNATFGTPEWAYMNVMDAYANILIGYTEGYGGGASSYRTMYQVTALDSLSAAQSFDTDQVIPILETMFQNITLSLLSDSSFQPNSTTAQPVAVTVEGFENVYDYQSEELFMAYGLGILVAIACFVLGLVSIHRNSGSYSNDFSTVLRTTRHLSLREVVDPAQSSGLSPLGKDLAEVKVVMMESNGDPDVPAGFRVARQPEA